MSGNGLIYLVIVAAWAAYLIPLWLRHQDDLNDACRRERLASAMRVLARRTQPALEQRYLLRPRSAPPVPVVKSAAALHSGGAKVPRSTVSPAVVARRRRVVGRLGCAFVVSVLGVWLDLLPWSAPTLALAVFTAYLVQLRILAHSERAAAGRRRSRPRQGSRSARTAGSARAAGSAPPSAAQAGVESGAGASSTAAADETVAAADEDGWEPVPVPLPTYVTAPKATPNVRTIDLTGNGAWTSNHLREEELPAPEVVPDATRVAVETGDDVAAEVQQARAVND